MGKYPRTGLPALAAPTRSTSDGSHASVVPGRTDPPAGDDGVGGVRRSRRLRFGFLSALTLLLPAPALAWGPHPRITVAAIETLGPRPALARHLGPEFELLPVYCWLADWKQSLVRRPPGGSFFADDYLLFPSSPVHKQHECPDVEATYRPFFWRAVQALRTESPENASRWVGSLLHFVEDSGSPPHAFRTSGELHTRMENWVDSGRIVLEGYRPRSFGETIDQAVNEFVARMNGLIAFSRERGQRLRPLAEAGLRAEAEPVVLESALETSRVVADLLFTLGQFSPEVVAGTASLRGRVISDPAPGAEAFPAKVILIGTDFSTLATGDGSYEFRNLPPGEYRSVVIRAGSEPSFRTVTLNADQSLVEEFRPGRTEPPGNLIRDPRFQVRWLNPQAPDGWHKGRKDGAEFWQSEPMPVTAGTRYRLTVTWRPDAHGEAVILWDRNPPKAHEQGFRIDHYYGTKVTDEVLTTESETSEKVYLAPAGARYALVVFRGQTRPDILCECLTLAPVPGNP